MTQPAPSPAASDAGPPLRRGSAVWLAATTVTAALVGLMVWDGYPGLHADSVAYTVPAFLRTPAGDLHSPLYTPYHVFEPAGAYLFDFHGPLQVIVLSRLFGCATPLDAVHALAVVAGLTVLVHGLVRHLRGAPADGAGALLIDLAGLAVVAQVVLYLTGRPELFAVGLVELALLAALRLRRLVPLMVALGAVAALVALAAPQTGLVFAGVAAAFTAWRFGGRRLLAAAAIATTTAIVVAFGLVAVTHPYSLARLVEKSLAAGINIGGSSKVVSFWFGRSGVPLLGVTYSAGIGAAAVYLWRRRSRAAFPLGVGVALLGALALGVRLGVVTSATHYNVLALTGLVVFALARPTAPRRLRAAALSAAALPVAITLAGFGWYHATGVVLDAGRTRWTRTALPTAEGRAVGIPQWGRPSFWVLTDDLSRVRTFSAWAFAQHERDVGFRYDALVVQPGAPLDPAVAAAFESPPAVEPAPAWLGWIVGIHDRPDYAFVVLRRRSD